MAWAELPRMTVHRKCHLKFCSVVNCDDGIKQNQLEWTKMTKARNFVHGGGLTDRDLKLDSGLLNLIQAPRRPDLVTACMTERGTGNGRQQTHVRPMPRKVAG